MFARIAKFIPKSEMKEEFVNVVRKEVLPILKQQQGFVEFLPLVPENKMEKWITVTLWAEKHDAQRYEREVYPTVETIIRRYLATTVDHTHYNVEPSLCQHFVEALTS
jgi:quinol monooxygenase YgiN